MTLTQNNKPPAPIQNILLDTNIILYLGNICLADYLIGYLTEFAKRGFGLAISDVTINEALCNTTKIQEVKIIQTLNLFKTYQIAQNVLIASSRLSTLYKNENIPLSQISLSDKIIASTAILTGSLILTGDINDFPRPFFNESEQRLVQYQKRNKPQLLVLELLSPNYPVIVDRLNKRG